jgi:hypothetical protein
MSVRYYCDGCKRHIEGEELQQAADLARNCQKLDLFCSTNCEEFASAYWIEQDQVMRRATEQSMNTINKHRERFFADKRRKPKLEAVK